MHRHDLSKWRPALTSARGAQRIVRRDANYAPPTPTQVIASLSNGPPAGASDLRALVLDRLERDCGRNANHECQPLGPVLERGSGEAEAREFLPKRTTCDVAAPGCRTDATPSPKGSTPPTVALTSGSRRASGTSPVEIKKNSHRKVWSAVENQLLPRYTNDPATGGLGIYLVLWFGARHTVPVARGSAPTITGRNPPSAGRYLEPQ